MISVSISLECFYFVIVDYLHYLFLLFTLLSFYRNLFAEHDLFSLAFGTETSIEQFEIASICNSFC